MAKAIAAPAMHVAIAIPATAPLLTPSLLELLLVASASEGCSVVCVAEADAGVVVVMIVVCVREADIEAVFAFSGIPAWFAVLVKTAVVCAPATALAGS